MPLDDIAALLRAKDRDSIQICLDRHREWINGRIAEYEEALQRVPTADEWCTSTGKDGVMTQDSKSYQCSFCGKDNKDVRRVIAGPGGVAICNECVQECNELIAEYDSKAEGA